MEQNNEDIYFGDKICYLYPCTGIYCSYKREYIQQDEINKDSVAETLKYADDLSYIKPEYKDYYIATIPETQIHYVNKDLKENEKEKNDFLLNQPMIKAKEIKGYSPWYKSIVSGHRSAIIKDSKTGLYYRLKGCGNDEIGFNLKKADGYLTEFNTRWSQYVTTCFRELFFSEKVDENLKKKIRLNMDLSSLFL